MGCGVRDGGDVETVVEGHHDRERLLGLERPEVSAGFWLGIGLLVMIGVLCGVSWMYGEDRMGFIRFLLWCGVVFLACCMAVYVLGLVWFVTIRLPI